MRVLIFNPSFPPVPCGIGDYAARLHSALRTAGHAVTVVTSTSAAETDGVQALLPNWDATSYLRALPRFRSPRPDLVVSQYPSVLPGTRARLLYLLPALAKATLLRPRVTLIVHEFLRTQPAARRWLAMAFWAADRILVVAEAEREAVVAQYPWTATKLEVLPVASNIPRVVLSSRERSALRQELGTPLIVHFGLLNSPDKGVDDLLDALRDVEGVLALTGTLDETNPYHRAVAARIERMGLAQRVRWLGHLAPDAVAAHLQAADAVVLPFRHGVAAQNTSLLASLVNGAATVTTRGDQTPEWLLDGRSAILVDRGNPKALAAGIRRAYEAGDALRTGAAALAGRFDWSAVAAMVTDQSARSASAAG